MAHRVVNLAERFTRFTEQWSPKVVARLNDYEIKIVRIQGEFVWHTHDDTDELFLVLAGELTIRLRDGDVVLSAGEMHVARAASSTARSPPTGRRCSSTHRRRQHRRRGRPADRRVRRLARLMHRRNSGR
jgi:hypothetical protein